MLYVLSTQDRLRLLADSLDDRKLARRALALSEDMEDLEQRGKTFTGKYERLNEEANDFLCDWEADEEN